jgi:hypothetical protein
MAATAVSETKAFWIFETGEAPVLLHNYGFIRQGIQSREPAAA